MTEVEATGVGAIRTGIDGREAGDVNSACQSNGMAENREATIKEKMKETIQKRREQSQTLFSINEST